MRFFGGKERGAPKGSEAPKNRDLPKVDAVTDPDASLVAYYKGAANRETIVAQLSDQFRIQGKDGSFSVDTERVNGLMERIDQVRGREGSPKI